MTDMQVSFIDAKKRHRFVIEDFRNWSRWVSGSGRSVVLKGPVFTLSGTFFNGVRGYRIIIMANITNLLAQTRNGAHSSISPISEQFFNARFK